MQIKSTGYPRGGRRIMQMFEKLQELPLLMGLSKRELMTIVERIDFDFRKHAEGTVLAARDERADRAFFVLSGTVVAELNEAERGFLLTEWMGGGTIVIEPQNLWGLKQKFARTYSLETEGSTCSISKAQLSWLISNYEIVKTNVLSLVCNQLQTSTRLLREPWPGSTEERIRYVLSRYCLTRTGHKCVRIKMQTLAHLTGDARLSVSQVLNDWQQRGLAAIRRGVVDIPEFGKLG